MKDSLIKRVRLSTIELVASIITMGFGVFVLIYMNKTPSMYAKESSVNSPAFFPSIAAYGMIAIGVCLLITSFTTDKGKTKTINLYSFLLILIWICFAVSAEYMGFILAGVVSLCLTLLLYGVKKWSTIILVSILSPIAIYFILGVALHVKFPTLIL